VALVVQPARYGNGHRHRTDVVRVDDLARGASVAFGLGLVTEYAERDQHDVEVAETLEDVGHERVMRAAVGCVERDRLHPLRTGGAQGADRAVERFGLAGGKHDRVRTRRELAARRQRDVGTTAEHEHRLHRSESVLHRVTDSFASTRGGARGRCA
jgi:hypothetical protein